MKQFGTTLGAALAALVLSVLVTGCGVSKAKYATATADLTSKTEENKKLQEQLTASQTKSTDLEKQVASMQTSVDQLNTELEKQKKAVAEAQSTYEGMVSQMREEVSSGKVQVEKMRDGIRVNLAQDVLFKSGSADVDPAGKELLAKVAEELKQSKYEIVVIGHTDNQKIGSSLAKRFPDNWALGAARARSIVNVLEAGGVEPARLLVVSAGENRPRADNSTPDGRGQNRRIEVRLRPTEVEPQAAGTGQ